MQNGIAYKPEIDGLRAIAVIGVILFHLGLPWPAGGFVGVDIFFVISGYLITGNIVRRLDSGTFRLGEFYLGRMRRLLPALLATILVTAVAGASTLGPRDFSELGKSIAFATTYTSNIYFWQTSGYFDVDAIHKPLLHTWSLGVEEQFYLVWPALVLLAFRAGSRRYLVAAIALAGLASFVATERLVETYPTAVFYLFPFRVFELAIGAGLNFLPAFTNGSKPKPAWYNDAFLLLGITLIGLSYTFQEEGLPFPSRDALIPCIGAALLITFRQGKLLGGILRSHPAVYLGKISYSLYLVHWPVILFWIQRRGDVGSALDQALLALVILVLSIAMYRYVETPFRRAGKDNRKFALGAALGSGVLLAAGATMAMQYGWIFGIPREYQAIVEIDEASMRQSLFHEFRRLEKPVFDEGAVGKILIIGDSQAADFVNAVTAEGYPQSTSIRTFEVPRDCGTLYIPEQSSSEFWSAQNEMIKNELGVRFCKNLLSKLFDSSLVREADSIYIANYWKPWSVSYIQGTIDKLHELGGADVQIVGRKIMALSGKELILRKKDISELDKFASNYKDDEAVTINRELGRILPDNFLDISAFFCPSSGSCQVLSREGSLIQFDASHLTPVGARELGQWLKSTGRFRFDQQARTINRQVVANPAAS